MNLGIDYSILASIITISFLPLYIYRKKVFKFLYKNDLSIFFHDLKTYINESYPKINFDYSKIDFKDTKIEPNQHKILIIEEVLNQYINHNYIKKTQTNIKKELLWTSYEIDSEPKKQAPKDLAKRKELVISRDHNKCNRCGKSIKINTSMLVLIKNIDKGGTYHFENLTILCNDCYRLENSKNPTNILRELNIYDILVHKYLK